MMRTPAELKSGKTHRDENFPVASVIIHPRHRGIILAFYRFARAADDIADHPSASVEEKLALLDQMRRTLLGQSDTVSNPLRFVRCLPRAGSPGTPS